MPIINRLLSTGVDVFFFERDVNDMNSVDLASECGGAPDYNLSIIPDGTKVTFRRGNTVRRSVKINQGVASECIYNMLAVSPAFARLFGIKEGARYLLTYNTATKTITIQRKPVTFYTITVRTSTDIPKNRVVIGNGLGVGTALGITIGNGNLINLRKENAVVQLRLRKISHGFDFTDVFRINPDNARRLNLIPGITYRVSFNQITNTLRFYNRATPIRKGVR